MLATTSRRAGSAVLDSLEVKTMTDQITTRIENTTPPARRVSKRQVLANRKNGKLGGPKTNNGRKAVIKNAIKHGLLARAIVVNDYESVEDFHELFARLLNLYDPVGPVEEMLVEKIAVSWWRLRRVATAEVGMIRDHHRHTQEVAKHFKSFRQTPDFEGCAIKDMLPIEQDCKNLLRYETTFERQFYRALDQLDRLQRVRKGESIPAPINVNVITEQE